MGATACLEGNFCLAERTDFRFRFFCNFLLLFQITQLVDRFDHQENDESNNQEVDNRHQKRSIRKSNSTLFLCYSEGSPFWNADSSLVKLHVQVVKIHFA